MLGAVVDHEMRHRIALRSRERQRRINAREHAYSGSSPVSTKRLSSCSDQSAKRSDVAA